MYLIPKNIKTKKEIFKGFGIFECIAIAISLGIGYLFSLFITQYKLKVIFFCIPPLLMFLLLLPLPNGSTALTILKKFLNFYQSTKTAQPLLCGIFLCGFLFAVPSVFSCGRISDNLRCFTVGDAFACEDYF